MAIPQPGKLAPDFTLPTDGGDKVELSQFKGRKVVLYFYPKDDTSGCTLEAVTFTALAPEFAAAGAAVVGVSPDSVKSHDRFKAKHELGVILAADEERKAIEAYGAWGEKSMYGRKYMGVLRTTFLIGPDRRIAEVWENVKVKGHAEAVLAAVKAL
jgi:peroxiredoxin Q/BCP